MNDNLIDFGLRQLRDNLPPAMRVRASHASLRSAHAKRGWHSLTTFTTQDNVLLMSAFFFTKLYGESFERPYGTPPSRESIQAAFARVRSWTRRLDIFAAKYIIIPINLGLHWTLVILTHPGAAAEVYATPVARLTA